MNYIKAIRRAIEGACLFKSGVADWSAIRKHVYARGENPYPCKINSDEFEQYRSAVITAFEKYRQTNWGATYMSLLGKHLLACNDRKMNVLEIGSGKCMTIKNMTDGNPEAVFEYTSIDRATDDNCFGCRHIKMDVSDDLDDCFEIDDDYRFDILIIDIEPHGKEIEIYEKFVRYGATKHVIILKCVGWMDLYATLLADRFLSHLKCSNRLMDYFGIGDYNYFTRDVTVVASRDLGSDDVFVGELACLVEDWGGEFLQFLSSDVPSMVCKSTKKLIDHFKGLGVAPLDNKQNQEAESLNAPLNPLVTRSTFKHVSHPPK
jgi:hypothetical protein